MRAGFPTVGLIGGKHLWSMMRAPASALGIELLVLEDSGDLEKVREFAKRCDVVTFGDCTIALSSIRALELDGVVVRPSSLAVEKSREAFEDTQTQEYTLVMVARSPHGQATTWAPTQVKKGSDNSLVSITPAPTLSVSQSQELQQLALDAASEVKLIGVMAVEFLFEAGQFQIKKLSMHPHQGGNWSIEGACTDQFEQQLRAVLDLPLGDPGLVAKYCVTGDVVLGEKANLYRPYLHLMARSPALKFHQYQVEMLAGNLVAHLNILGDQADFLLNEIEHALDYISGKVEE